MESEKSSFSIFPVLKWLNQSKKKIKTIQNLLSLKFQQKSNILLFFH